MSSERSEIDFEADLNHIYSCITYRITAVSLAVTTFGERSHVERQKAQGDLPHFIIFWIMMDNSTLSHSRRLDGKSGKRLEKEEVRAQIAAQNA